MQRTSNARPINGQGKLATLQESFNRGTSKEREAFGNFRRQMGNWDILSCLLKKGNEATSNDVIF
jgi:hypothetical protein